MVNVLFFAYPQYADFEIAHTLFFLKKLGKAKITTVTVDGKSVQSIGGLTINAEASLHEIKINEYDLILISGGDGVEKVLEEDIVSNTLKSAFRLKIPIASICASATLLAKAGIIKNRKFTCLPTTLANYRHLFDECIYTGTDIEVEKGLITAKGTAFPAFTLETCKQVGLIKDNKQAEFVIQFCKGEST